MLQNHLPEAQMVAISRNTMEKGDEAFDCYDQRQSAGTCGLNQLRTLVPGLWIRIDLMRIRIRIRIQHFSNCGIRIQIPMLIQIRIQFQIQGFDDQKLKKMTAGNFFVPRPP